MDLIKTITDEDVVDAEESGSESEDDTGKPKARATRGKGDFSSAFRFVDNIDEYHYDSWQDVARFVKLKKSTKTTLEERIREAAIMRRRTRAEDATVDAPDVVDDDDVDSDNNEAADVIKVKGKNKNKKKANDASAEPLVRVEADEGDPFFEKNKQYGEISSFHQMNLSRPLLKAVTAMNFVTPTPIQAATIPVALLGRDVCGCAATGTGKTAAYMLPVLERLIFKPAAAAVTRVLVLVPTRELGVQVFQVAKQLSQFTRIQIGLSVGGLDIKAQEASLRSSPDIVIATPGRLIDHIHNTPTFHLEDIELLILDEADRMLDEHFAEQLKEIVKECSPARQTMLFSATMTESVQDLASLSLKKPVKIFINSNQTVAENLRQEFVKVRKNGEGDREAIVAALLTRTFHDHVIVFLPTKKAAHRLHVSFGLMGIKAGELHGDMNQVERLNTLRKFKEEEYDVLLATDVAARGLDIHGVKTVINIELPNSFQHYIHRVGRTARAGRVGRSVSLVGEKDRKLFKEIVKNALNPVKSRAIPAEVVAKYKKELEEVATEVDRILEDQATDVELKKADNAALRADQVMDSKGPQPMKREWFQQGGKKRPREDEEDDLTPSGKKRRRDILAGSKMKPRSEIHPLNWRHKKKYDEMKKSMDFQARAAKRAGRQKRTRALDDDWSGGGGGGGGDAKGGKSKKKSSFEKDLTNVSRKNVKKFRHKATAFKNEQARGKKKGGRR